MYVHVHVLYTRLHVHIHVLYTRLHIHVLYTRVHVHIHVPILLNHACAALLYSSIQDMYNVYCNVLYCTVHCTL